MEGGAGDIAMICESAIRSWYACKEDPAPHSRGIDVVGSGTRLLTTFLALPELEKSTAAILPNSACARTARFSLYSVSLIGAASPRLFHLRAPHQKRRRHCPICFTWPVRIRRLKPPDGIQLIVVGRRHCTAYQTADGQH